MNALVIYYSKFGHTKLPAETIAGGLDPNGNARAIDIEIFDPAGLAEADLVVMGSPTHKMNLPDAMAAAMGALPKGSLRSAQVAAFDTSYRTSGFLARFTAAKKLDRKLRRLGGKRIAPPETFFVTGREGPLEDGEIERAQAWAEYIGNTRRAGEPPR